MNIKQEIARFVREEEGAGIIEYSLIAAVMAAIIIAALESGIGPIITGALTKIGADISGANAGTAG